jgi:xanthine dehydrogenase YagT iron-sulfur-binding subunit
MKPFPQRLKRQRRTWRSASNFRWNRARWDAMSKKPQEPGPSGVRLTRRAFLASAGTVGVATAINPQQLMAQPMNSSTKSEAAAVAAAGTLVTLRINGTEHKLRLDPRTTLLDTLREHVVLTGTKKGCDHGQCGACTVHVNGRRVNSCLTFAVMHAGDEITTIEGVGQPGALHPVQSAFVEHDAYQCGYCTSGQIMSAVALLKEPCGPNDADVRECMAGNICRCGAYPNIVAAVQQARGKA